jgi:hypothetical protein
VSFSIRIKQVSFHELEDCGLSLRGLLQDSCATVTNLHAAKLGAIGWREGELRC